MTTHPGQFTQLGSPTKKVVDNSLRELECTSFPSLSLFSQVYSTKLTSHFVDHNEMLDRMGLDTDSVMIIHMGGVYGDKPAALERFKNVYKTRVSERVKRRLVLENDEASSRIQIACLRLTRLILNLNLQLCYNVDDLLPISLELGIPIVVSFVI